MAATANSSIMNGINFSRLDSPANDKRSANMEQMAENLESITNAQKCIEKTLSHVVEAIVNIKNDVTQIEKSKTEDQWKETKVEDQQQTTNHEVHDKLTSLENEIKNISKKIQDLNKKKGLSKTLEDCCVKVDDLLKNLANSRKDVDAITRDLAGLRDNAVETMKKSVDDMGSYYNSVFADETREQIKAIYAHVTTILHDEAVQTETNVRPTSAESSQQPSIPSQPIPFTFPDPIRPSLKILVESNQRINVLLITDSIMKHIEAKSLTFRKYRIGFQRIDATCSKTLVDGNLEDALAKDPPHLAFVHLGIHDIHKGTSPSEVLNNFRKFEEMLRRVSPHSKLIISSPLLNGKSFHERLIFSLRHKLNLFVNNLEAGNKDPTTQRVLLQKNNKFFRPTESTRVQNSLYFGNDHLHLSERGRIAITCTMRDTIESVLNQFLPTI